MIVLSERLPYILAAGNSVIIKSSEYGNLSIYYFIKLIEKQGLPLGTINFITGDSNTGKKLIAYNEINMISFTGSTNTGKEIYKVASNSVKRLSLELGGKNPMAIFSDANLDKAADDVLYSFTHNAGQCCVSGSKLFIDKKIYSKFINLLKAKIKNIKIYQSTTTEDQYKKIKRIINLSIKRKIPILYKNKILFDDKKKIIYPIIFKKIKIQKY